MDRSLAPMGERVPSSWNFLIALGWAFLRSFLVKLIRFVDHGLRVG